MNTRPSSNATRGHSRHHEQRGSFLLEALVGIAIMSFGILGIVGLQAQSIRWVNDAQYRSEAVYHANAVIAQMWADNPANLATEYALANNGPGYKAFKAAVSAPPPYGLPQADQAGYAPIITVAAGPSNNSSIVTVTVRWRLPGEKAGGFDGLGGSQYQTSAVIGSN